MVLQVVACQRFYASDDKAPTAKEYVVWVFRLADGKWKKEEDKTLSTGSLEGAWAYANSFLDRPDWQEWTTTTNAPLDTRPLPASMSMAMASRLLVGKWTQEPDSFLATDDQQTVTILISPDFTARFIVRPRKGGNATRDDKATWAVKDGELGLVGKEDEWLMWFRIKGTGLVQLFGDEESSRYLHVSVEPKE